MLKKFLFLILCVFVWISNLFSQDIDSIRTKKSFIHLYKENAELSYTSPLSEIGAPSKYIISGKLTTTYMLLGAPNIPISFAVIPEFTVRVRDEQSAGVRTPSFKLGGTTFIRLNQNEKAYQYAELSFAHHSNGQDGEAINPDGSINTFNGNFSTNYLTTSYRFGNFSELSSSSNTFNSFNHRIGLQWNKWFSYEKALEDNYGFTRILYNLSYRKYALYSLGKNGKPKRKTTENQSESVEKEYLRVNTEFSYAINKINNFQIFEPKKRLNAEVSVHYSFPFMNNVFLMAGAGYYGEDPYNIYFNDKYSYFRFGISTGFIRNRIN